MSEYLAFAKEIVFEEMLGVVRSLHPDMVPGLQVLTAEELVSGLTADEASAIFEEAVSL